MACGSRARRAAAVESAESDNSDVFVDASSEVPSVGVRPRPPYSFPRPNQPQTSTATPPRTVMQGRVMVPRRAGRIRTGRVAVTPPPPTPRTTRSQATSPVVRLPQARSASRGPGPSPPPQRLELPVLRMGTITVSRLIQSGVGEPSSSPRPTQAAGTISARAATEPLSEPSPAAAAPRATSAPPSTPAVVASAQLLPTPPVTPDGDDAATRFAFAGQEGSVLSQISLEHLQCPVCLDTIRQKPIYQCHNGHTVCSSCLPQLRSCPLCRVCMAGGRIRNRALEAILDFVQVTCPHHAKGCPAVVKSVDLKKHLLECTFGKYVLCPSLGFEDCRSEICIGDWQQHVITAHNDLRLVPGVKDHLLITYHDFMSTKTIKDGNLITWKPLVLTPFPDTGPFVLHSSVDASDKHMANFTVTYAPPVPVVSEGSAYDGSELDAIPTSYFVKFSFGGRESWVTAEWTWTGKSVLVSELKKGGKGEFRVPLECYLQSSPPDSDEDLGAVLPPSPLHNSLPPGLGTAPATAAASTRRLGTTRRPLNIKRDLKLKIGIYKTKEDAAKPWPEDGSPVSYLKYDLFEYTPSKNATFRAKCAECSVPLRGVKYRCAECLKYELCSKCMHEKDVHSHHAFLVIRTTEQNSRVNKIFKRIYKPGPEADVEEDEQEEAQPTGRRRRARNAPRNQNAAGTSNETTGAQPVS